MNLRIQKRSGKRGLDGCRINSAGSFLVRLTDYPEVETAGTG